MHGGREVNQWSRQRLLSNHCCSHQSHYYKQAIMQIDDGCKWWCWLVSEDLCNSARKTGSKQLRIACACARKEARVNFQLNQNSKIFTPLKFFLHRIWTAFLFKRKLAVNKRFLKHLLRWCRAHLGFLKTFNLKINQIFLLLLLHRFLKRLTHF